MSEDLTNLNDGNFANRIIYLLDDSLSLARMWGFYLRNEEMSHEQELHNKITAIWIRGLIDAIEGEQRFLASFKEESTRRNFRNMVCICDRIAEYFQSVKKVLAEFTKDEQIFLFYVRNMLVHGWVNGAHADQITIKFFDGKNIENEHLDRESFWNLKRRFLGDTYTGTVVLDPILAPMTKRFLANSEYWEMLGKVLSSDFDEASSRGIAKDLGILDQYNSDRLEAAHNRHLPRI